MIPIVEWWLDRARDYIRRDERNLEELGKALARHIPGKSKFDHGQLSRFKNGQVGATWELMVAICMEWDLLPPVIVTRSENEANDMHRVSKKYNPPKEPVVIGLPIPRPSLAEIIRFPKKEARVRRVKPEDSKRNAR